MMNFDNLIQPFVLTWPLALIAAMYAIIRAKHDSYINAGPWKDYALAEGVLVAVSISWFYKDMFWEIFLLPFIFGLWFWIVFDIMCGVFRAGKIFYWGSDTFDQNMKRIFVHPAVFLTFKVVFLILISGTYYSIIKAM